MPLSDPILVSYANALAQDVLCVWQNLRCTAPCCNSNSKDESTSSITDHNHGPNCFGSKCCHVFGSGMKELWLFWFGDDPNLSNILSSELKGNSQIEIILNVYAVSVAKVLSIKPLS